MRCPLCKEPVQDKETLQVHYITSCTGYQQDGATGQGDTPGSGATISGSRKARVTFLWKKSLPTLEHEIYLFSTFDQVKLEWESSIEIFKSRPTEVARGTYGDCQLVVSGELYPTKPIVIEQESQTVRIQLPQVGVIEEIPAPQDDWRRRLADDDRRAAGTSVDPGAAGTSVDPGAAISLRTQPKDKMKYDQARRGDGSSAVGHQETQGQMGRVGHTFQPNGPTYQRQLSDGAANSAVVDLNRGTSHQSRDSRRQFGHLGHEVASGTASGVASEYSRNGKQHLCVAQNAQVVGDSLRQPASVLASRHDTHVDEMKEVSSIYNFPVNQGPADGGGMAQQQSSSMDVDTQAVEATPDSNQSTSDAAWQRHPAQTEPRWSHGNIHPSIATRQEHETRHVRHRPPHADLANTRMQQLQAERDQFAVELNRYGETIKVLSAKLEQQQSHQNQLLHSEKELQRTVSQLKQLLGEKEVMEQTFQRTVTDLKQQNETLQREARSVYQQNRDLQQVQQEAEAMKKQLRYTAAHKEEAVETLRKIQEKLESATKYNTHLQEELRNCHEQVLQEKTASSDMNRVNLQLQESTRRLEAEVVLQRQQQQEVSLREQHMISQMESLRSNMEGLQLTNETLKEQLDQLERDRTGIVDERTKKETELTQKARQYRDMESKCLLLENEVKQREKEYNAIAQQQSMLENALAAANLQKEEVEGAMVSVETEKTDLERELKKQRQKRKQLEEELNQMKSALREKDSHQSEVVELKAQLANQQRQLQQLADDKRELAAKVEDDQSYREQYEALVATVSALREDRKEQGARCRELQRHIEETEKRHSCEDSQRLYEANMKVTELTDERNELQQRLTAIESQYQQDKGTLRETGKQLQQSVAECMSLKDQLQQLREGVEEEKVQQGSVEQEKNTLRDEVEGLISMNETQLRELEVLRQTRQQLQKQLTQCEAERNRLEQDLDQYAQQHKERDAAFAELTAARSQLIMEKERLQNKLQLQKDQTQKLQSHLDARTAELERLRNSGDAEKRENKSRLKKAEDRNKFLEEEVARLKQTGHQLESEKNDLRSEVTRLSGTVRTAEKEISDLSENKRRLCLEVEGLQSKQEDLTRCYGSTISKERDAKIKSKELKEQLVTFKRDLETVRLDLDAEREEKESARQRAEQAEERSRYLTEQLERYKEDKRSLHQELKELREVRNDQQRTEIENGGLHEQLNTLSTQLKRVEANERELQSLQSHNEFVTKERQDLADRLSTAEKQREELGKENEQLNQDLLSSKAAYKVLHQRLKESRQHISKGVVDGEFLKSDVVIEGMKEDNPMSGVAPPSQGMSQNKSSQAEDEKLRSTRSSSRRSLKVSSLPSQHGMASGVSQPATKSVRSPPVKSTGGHIPDLQTSSARALSPAITPVNWDWLVVGARMNISLSGDQDVTGVVKYINPLTGSYPERMVGVELDMPVGNMSGYDKDGRRLFKCKVNHGLLLPAWQLLQETDV